MPSRPLWPLCSSVPRPHEDTPELPNRASMSLMVLAGPGGFDSDPDAPALLSLAAMSTLHCGESTGKERECACAKGGGGGTQLTPPVRRRAASMSCAPRVACWARASLHSRQRLLRRWWTQMPDPPHSLQWLRSRWCSQICDPPHSLHWPLMRL